MAGYMDVVIVGEVVKTELKRFKDRPGGFVTVSVRTMGPRRTSGGDVKRMPVWAQIKTFERETMGAVLKTIHAGQMVKITTDCVDGSSYTFKDRREESRTLTRLDISLDNPGTELRHFGESNEDKEELRSVLDTGTDTMLAELEALDDTADESLEEEFLVPGA